MISRQTQAPAAVTPATQDWEGAIIAVDNHGALRGYVHVPNARSAPEAIITLDGSKIADALADRFNPLYFQKPGWHGHHEFVARLNREIAAGPHQAVLTVRGLPGATQVTITLAKSGSRLPLRVETLLPPPPRWRSEDLRARPEVLNLQTFRENAGDTSLLDRLYHFVLERFPSKGEMVARLLELTQGWRTPEQILCELLAEPEFIARKSPLACPFDLEFPFPAGERIIA